MLISGRRSRSGFVLFNSRIPLSEHTCVDGHERRGQRADLRRPLSRAATVVVQPLSVSAQRGEMRRSTARKLLNRHSLAIFETHVTEETGGSISWVEPGEPAIPPRLLGKRHDDPLAIHPGAGFGIPGGGRDSGSSLRVAAGPRFDFHRAVSQRSWNFMLSGSMPAAIRGECNAHTPLYQHQVFIPLIIKYPGQGIQTVSLRRQEVHSHSLPLRGTL